MVVCLEQGADLHVAQLMPLLLTISCYLGLSKIQIGFTFLVQAHLGSHQGADLHMAQLMPLLLTISCFSKIQTGFTFLVPAYLGSPEKGPLNVCVCN